MWVIVNESNSHLSAFPSSFLTEPRMESVSNSNDVDCLIDEHQTLMRHYGKAQSRCSDLVAAQAAELVALRAQAFRLRAEVVIRETALLWERDDRRKWEALVPGLPRRAALARRVDQLVGRVHELMRERLRWQWRRMPEPPPASTMPGWDASAPVGIELPSVVQVEPTKAVDVFEASLIAADLVICQTGCLSHDAYWRVQDHCERTGKACVVVAQPDAVRIVRFHAAQPLAATVVDAAPLGR
jgi:hypothetical protein